MNEMNGKNKASALSSADKSFSDSMLSEQLNLISQQIKFILLIVLLISFLAAYTLWHIVPYNLLILWFALVNFPSLMRLCLFQAQRRYEIEIRLLGLLNICLAAWSGTAWGAMGIYFPPFGDSSTLQFITVVLFGVTAGSVPGLSSFFPCYMAFSVPVMTSLAYRYYSYGDNMNTSASIYCMIFLVINLAFSLVIQKSLRQSIWLRHKNTNLVRNLRLEKNKAISASNAKSSFLAAASHDLRQPLHAMGFFIESLKKSLDKTAQLYILQKIERTSNALRGQLDDLLDISKIDAGVITPHITPLSVNDLFQTILRMLSPLAQEKDITLKCFPVSWIIESDAHMIDRVLNNLVSNAIRYTNKGGKILLGCRKIGDHLRLEIHDTGIGIPNHLIEQVFAEYYQINNPERDKNKGLGLGLSIVKGMCDLLDHKIEIRSRIGKGTSFRITVPLSNRLPLRLKENSPKAAPTMHTGTIILIEDENDVLEAMSLLIGSWGHELLAFGAGKEALDYITKHDLVPDIILTDFRLRERRTGLQAINAINAHMGRSIPAIIITGDTAKDRIIQAKESGHILLHKPIEPNKLKRVIDKILQDKTA